MQLKRWTILRGFGAPLKGPETLAELQWVSTQALQESQQVAVS